jgi:uncharacterized protein (TIGR02266 family)
MNRKMEIKFDNTIMEYPRYSSRALTNIPVNFTSDNKTQKGIILNISVTGIFIYTSEALKEGDNTRLRFSLPGTDRLIEAVGKVSWAKQLPDQRSLDNGMGVQFTRITPESREHIISLVKRELDRVTF